MDSDCRHLTSAFRTLGGLILCASALSGCSGLFGSGESEYRQLQNQRKGMAEVIQEAGGSAILEAHTLHGFKAHGWMVDLSGAEMTDDIVETVLEMARHKPVLQLNLSGSTVTNEQLAQFDEGKVLQKVVILDLSDTAITDAGLDGLSNHYIIGELNLKGSQATAAAAERLGDRQIASPQTPQPFKKQPELKI